MNRLFRCLFLLWMAGALPSQAIPHPPGFAKEIQAFTNADITNPPPQNAVLFIGASSIRKWSTLKHDFPGHTVINRGFGGSQISDSVFYFDQIVLPYKPKVIVFYAGSNDLNAGKTPDTVVADFKAFVQKVESALPETKVAFISINASPSRWKDVDKIKQANAAISEFMGQDPKRAFLDTYSAMLDSDGHARPELYLADRLHPNAQGYAIWTKIIAPYLAKVD